MSLLENLLSHGTVERLGWMLVHFLWQAAVVAAMLAVFLRLLRGAGASLRYVVACCALLLMVVLPVVTMQLVEVEGPAAESGPPAVIAPPAMEPLTPTEVQIVDEMPPFAEAATPLEIADLAAPVSSWERIASVLRPALPYLVVAWLIGVFGLSAWHLGGWMQLQRLKRRMVHQVAPALLARSKELASRLGVRRAVTLLESALVEVPTVVGWLRPVILLPASALTGLSVEQLEAILAHELAHIRRYDYLVNLLQTLVEILGFYHPAVWWVSHRIRIERENCCDDVAVRLCGDSVRYARALTHLEEIRHRRTELAIAASGGSLIDRIARLLGRPATDNPRFAWLPGLIALLLVAGIVIPAALALNGPNPHPVANDAPGTTNAAQEETGSDELPTSEPNAPGVDARSGKRRYLTGSERTHVLLDIKFVKVWTDLRPDRETALAILNTLERQSPADTAAPNLDTTLGEIFRTYVVQQPLSEQVTEVLLNLLKSRGYLEVISSPQVMARDGERSRIAITTEEHFFREDSNDIPKVEVGMQLDIMATVVSRGRVELDMTASVTDMAPQPEGDTRPTVFRTSAQARVTAPNDRFLAWAAIEPENNQTDQETDKASLYILTRPLIIPPAQERPAGTVMPEATVPHPRQVRLDVRTVRIEHDALLNLGIEWGRPTRVSTSSDPSGAAAPEAWAWNLQLALVSDRQLTESLLPALDRLQRNNQANISSQQILTQEGREAQIKNIKEQWLRSVDQKIDTGNTVSVTPRLGENDAITLEMAFEVSSTVPHGRAGVDLPVVTRRTARNAVTIRDGDTVVLAGMVEAPAGEVVLFVTAHLMPDGDPPERLDLPPGMGALKIEPGRADVPPELLAVTRRQAVNDDPRIRALNEEIAKLEVDLIRARQTMMEDHPQIAAIRSQIDSLKKRSDQIRRELEREYDGLSGARSGDEAEPSIAAASAEIQVECRFVLVDDEWMEAFTQGLPVPGVASPEDVNALHAIGAGLSMDNAQPLNPDQTHLLLDAVRGHPGNSMLAAPRVSVLSGEGATVSLSDRLNYISGYTEPNDPSQEPIPTHDSQTVGLTCTITPKLVANGNAIRLDLTADLRSLLEIRELTYRDAYKYEAPVFKDVLIQSEMTLPEGWSALLLGDKIAGITSTPPDADTPPRHLLVLLNATWTDPPPPPPAATPSSGQEPANTGQTTITGTFAGEDLRRVLQNLADLSDVPVMADEEVTGRVWADLKDVDLPGALEIVFAGTPYVARPTLHSYVVATPDKISGLDRSETVK